MEQGNAFTRFAAFRTRSGLSMTPVVGDEILPVSAYQAAEDAGCLGLLYAHRESGLGSLPRRGRIHSDFPVTRETGQMRIATGVG